MRRRMLSLGAGSLAIVVLACGPSERSRRAAESAVAAARARSVTEAGEVLGTRREAQQYLDSARAQFLAKRTTAAKVSLYEAARFTREQSSASAEPAKSALVKAADELDALALRAGKRSIGSVKTLDRAFARVQLAEAQFHCVRAIAAWQNEDMAATAAELLMLTDHAERAASDAGEPLGPDARATLVDARSIASKLAQGVAVAPTDVDGVLGRVDEQVHALMKKAANLKS